MGEAPLRVTSLQASEPTMAGKETVEDLLCAGHHALILPCRDDFHTSPEAARASSP